MREKYFDWQSLHLRRNFFSDRFLATPRLNCEISEEWGREDAAPPLPSRRCIDKAHNGSTRWGMLTAPSLSWADPSLGLP